MKVCRYAAGRAGAGDASATTSAVEEWNRFVDASWSSVFLLNRHYMDYHVDRFEDHSLLMYDDQDRLVCVIPGHAVDREWRSHGGLTYGGLVFAKPASQRSVLECLAALLGYLRGNGFERAYYKALPQIYYSRRYENIEFGLIHSGFRLCRRDASTSVVLSERSKLPKGRKASIQKARRNELVVSESEDWASFFALQDTNIKKKYDASSVHSASEMELLASRFTERIKLYSVCTREAGEGADPPWIAGAVVYLTDRVMHLQYFAMNEEGESLGATDLIIETLIESCPDRGLEVFDFGISTQQDGLFLNEGLNRYKESFGGVTTLCDAYEIDLGGKA